MAEKVLSSRIIHKHDVAANWSKAANFVPKQGELIVYDIDADYAYERIKVGDGERNVNSLPFVDEALRATLTELINAVDDKVDEVSALVGDTSVSEQINTAIEAIPDGFSGSWNDLANRPFYEESRVLYEGYPEYSWGYAKLPLTLKAGTSYSVGWFNGDIMTAFDCVAAVNNYGVVSIEHIDPEYLTGFELQYIESEGLCYFYGHGSMFQEGMPETSEDGSYTYTSTIKLQIAYCNDDDAGVKTLDEKYIPSTISRVGHTHDDVYYTETEVDAKLGEINAAIGEIVDGSSVIAEATHASSADTATHATSADTATQADSATSATKATQDGSGQVITDTYETKTDAAAKLTAANKYTDDELDRLVGDTTVSEQIAAANIIYVGPTEPTDPNIQVWINTAEESTGIIPVLPRIATITLDADSWSGNSAPYEQEVEIATVTSATKVELNPNVSQILSLQNDDIALMAENDGTGVIKIYSFGGKPSSTMTMQCTLVEVSYL